ncbi:MAG: U32 family peptidase [Desulfobacterales bacterium]|nr:U32 family peptidase [Desulfobacterales bacterium]
MTQDMEQQPGKKMELLAPAGTLAVFEVAVESGADAVYIGAPALNARALSRDFTWAELAALVDFARSRRVKLYVAMNSLVKEEEIPLAVETLARLSSLKADAVIVQDLGVYSLARNHFPGLRLHASTLFLAHNSLGVKKCSDLGFKRVVLARELCIKEIAAIHRQTPVELEVFVHGALCFAYSGLCLFSSSLGGRSGLRGFCVQPCRRRYTWENRGRKKGNQPGGYFFSMNDLAAVELLPELARAGVTSLKIEGRLRNAHHVGSVVKAYRTMLDAGPGDRGAALARARELLDLSMGRRACTGYFKNPQSRDIISPHHSGNIGVFLGKVERLRQGRPQLMTRAVIQAGDRLRVHREKSGERFSFTLKKIQAANGSGIKTATAGERITIDCPQPVKSGDPVYLVDTRQGRALERRQRLIDPGPFKKKTARLLDRKQVAAVLASLGPAPSSRQPRRSKGTLPLWLKLDTMQGLNQRLPFKPEQVLVTLGRETFAQAEKMGRKLASLRRRLIWALPPVILEQDLDFYGRAIDFMGRAGFTSWQVGHISQTLLLNHIKDVRLIGDYTLNVLNSAALAALGKNGFQRAQIAVEVDKKTLADICRHQGGKPAVAPGMTVFGRIPLFTARLRAEHFRYQARFVSPRGEAYELVQRWGATLALPDRPFSLLAQLPELGAMGLDYGVVDLSYLKRDRNFFNNLARELQGGRGGKPASTFNYHGRLL